MLSYENAPYARNIIIQISAQTAIKNAKCSFTRLAVRKMVDF